MRAFPRAGALVALALVTATAGMFAAGSPTTAMAQAAENPMTTASGLQITDTKVGTGATPKPGQICVMHYTGWLYENGAKGRKFDSSVDRGRPFEFPIGQQRVIAGWDEGVATMKVGGKRTLVIPPTLGYGARGARCDPPERHPDLRRRIARREGLISGWPRRPHAALGRRQPPAAGASCGEVPARRVRSQRHALARAAVETSAKLLARLTG